MDKKVYEKTRYQNIYRHKKNKNYVIMLSKPVKTSISKIDGKKILTTEEAIKIRDNVLIRRQKGIEVQHRDDFDSLYNKYMDDCKNVRKLAYNSLLRKQKTFNRYLKGKTSILLTKTNKEYWAKFIDDCDCSLKQKNQILKELKAFFNWCLRNEYILNNPTNYIYTYKVAKTEMKYWTPSELKAFLNTLEIDLSSNDINTKKSAYSIKTLTIIGFLLGDRIGETRALTFNSLNKETKTILINHSINYDTSSDDYLSTTKNYQSQRLIDITDKLINTIKEYRQFLEIEMNYPVTDSSIIFFNYKTGKPYSDTALRKQFYKYCEKANVKRIRMYDLRHTYVATMMAENKELYNISERIGHKNFNTTINKYGHLSNKVRKEIAGVTDKYI